MAEEVIGPKVALRGCLTVGGFILLVFIIVSICYLIYIFYIDDSLPQNYQGANISLDSPSRLLFSVFL